ncbi:Trm112 family protein [Streptomyces beigongshangae]|uniref:Trm112 family protein n=1 Tax=Streptomyces beigongshangae TaxID=2841597 RepID=UPI0027DEB85E|nr:Trm112 family protein [Streptomyces sp. REN17]
MLACPLDKGPLHLLTNTNTSTNGNGNGKETGAQGEGGSPESTGHALYNPRLRRRYPIVDGIPQLLPSSGEQVTDEEHEELLLRIGGNEGGNGSGGGTGGSPDGPRRPGTRTP